MINTFSKFHYGIEITSTTNYLDFNEGTGQISCVLRNGNYTFDTLADEIEYQMNQIGTQAYSVSVNRSTNKITISAASAWTLLAGTGTNAANGCYTALGYSLSDTSSSTSHVANNAIGLTYYPQYKLQDYVSAEDNQSLRNESVMVSASGKVEVISFGTDKMFEFNIKFATNIYQPSVGPIINNKTGVDDLRTFMVYCKNKYEIDFYPDKNDVTVYYRVVLESSPADSKGTGFKLEEQYTRGLVGYFESGLLKFRVIEE